MNETTLCYIERGGQYLMLHRTKKVNDVNHDKWLGIGGHIEPGETPQQALVREIWEELDTEIRVGSLLGRVEYDYPAFHLSMDCFWCEILSGDLALREHEAARWVSAEQLDSLPWLPADRALIPLCKAGLA